MLCEKAVKNDVRSSNQTLQSFGGHKIPVQGQIKCMCRIQIGKRCTNTNFRITLRDYLKSDNFKHDLGRKTVLTREQEQDFVKRIIRFAGLGIPLTPKIILL